MSAHYSASRLALCLLAMLLLAAACYPITSPNLPTMTPVARVAAVTPAGTAVATAAAPPPVSTVAPTAPATATVPPVSTVGPTAPAAAGAVSTVAATAPAAAPAGERLVFASDRSGNFELYVLEVPPAGTKPAGPPPVRQLTSDGKKSIRPAVSPDGQWVAYWLEDASKTPPQRDIWLVSIDGQKRANLTQNPALNMYPAWSPDGAQIAFVSTREGASQLSIWIQDVAPILAGQAPAPRKLVDGSMPLWSPDGSQIAFLAAKPGESLVQLYTIKPDGTGQRQLTAHSTEGNGPGMGVPAWQPDGRWIMAPMDFGPVRRLVLLPVEGTAAPIPDADLRIVTPGEEYADTPAWEADSRWVALVVGRDPNASIAVMDMQSGEVRRILPQLSGLEPVWSPDGTRLAFYVLEQAPSLQQDVYVADRDGSGLLNVTDNPANDFGPAWVPPNQRPK